MSLKEQLRKIGEFQYELPKQGKMNVPGLVFASEKLLKDIEENALQQVVNVACLPGIVGRSIAMPDVHVGYGFPIGGVAAFDMKEGIISPGGVGYDIDCSVRFLTTNISVAEFEKNKKEILHSIFRAVPSGVGRGSGFSLNYNELDNILKKGASWAVEKGFGLKEDLKNLEDQGNLTPCNPEDVSKKAKSRGIGQLGTLGAGNHFLEIQKVDKIFNEEKARALGIKKDNIAIMIHCGSRGLGHQVASDYIKLMEDKYGFENLPDRELINAPIKSELGKKYFSAMNCAANFAFANKQLITHNLRNQLKHYFPKSDIKVVYEVCHNIAKVEKHTVNGKERELLIMRKGATRAFNNQTIIIPGSMGTASYILSGTKKAEELTFASTAHGAGRLESRTKARRELTTEKVKKELEEKNISVEAGSSNGLVEEAPEAYKDIDEVIRVSGQTGIGEPVVRLIPLAVMKG